MKDPFSNQYRYAWAGELRTDHVDGTHRVAGWVHRRRDHGGLIFIDVRDRTGLLQVVFHPDTAPEAHAAAHKLRSEDVVSVQGVVVPREEGAVNPNLATGEIELSARELDVLADAETPPFEIVETTKPVSEDTRLRYRYLDLRREEMQRNMELRHNVTQAMRRVLHDADFLELETPILTRSTPEGARDFLVPARLQPGSFYALPQSPQLFKELFMIAGYERYYQIARCFRDEDLRADRQPEFTQLDMEMSFVGEDDVIALVDAMLKEVLAVGGLEVDTPLERITYDEAMLRWGSDRPDRRIGMEIKELNEVFEGTEFKVFADVIGRGDVIRGFAVPETLARKRVDDLTEQARRAGAGGLVWAVIDPDAVRSPVAKFVGDDALRRAAELLGADEGDTLLIVADRAKVAANVLGQLRLAVAPDDVEGHDIFWVVDFPAFEWNEDEERWDPLHHPFTAPAGDLEGDPGTWRSRGYDVVLDGTEIGGGSIRINRPDVQRKVFEVIGMTSEEADERFGFLLEALKYGAPPLGGIAFGLDRIVAILAGRESIRDVMAFPKTATGGDPMTGAPAPVDTRQLKELGLQTTTPLPSSGEPGPGARR
jgi:aspartyl-tRNA synthetase